MADVHFEKGPQLCYVIEDAYFSYFFQLHQQFALLKYGFHNKSFILNATLVSCPICSHPLWVGAAANPPKADDWNWATDQRCI